jgi:predicted RNase H-like nuclease (RuvC/YqgF family)
MPNELKTFDVEDDDGNTISTVAASAVDDLKKQIEEKDAMIKSQSEKMERDIPKGESFRALDKKVQKAEEEKTELVSRLEAIEKEREADKLSRAEFLKKRRIEMVDRRAGGNKELADKIDFFYGRFAGDATTDEEIEQRVEEATFLAKRRIESPTAFSRGATAGGSSYVPEPKTTDFSQTEEGIATAKALGLGFTKLKK